MGSGPPGSDTYPGAMILERALLPVRPGHETAFEAAFAQARPLTAEHLVTVAEPVDA